MTHAGHIVAVADAGVGPGLPTCIVPLLARRALPNFVQFCVERQFLRFSPKPQQRHLQEQPKNHSVLAAAPLQEFPMLRESAVGESSRHVRGRRDAACLEDPMWRANVSDCKSMNQRWPALNLQYHSGALHWPRGK